MKRLSGSAYQTVSSSSRMSMLQPFVISTVSGDMTGLVMQKRLMDGLRSSLIYLAVEARWIKCLVQCHSPFSLG